MPEFEIDDEVTIVVGSEHEGADDLYNPPNGVMGVIVATGRFGEYRYRVSWSTGMKNNYRPEDLEFFYKSKRKSGRVSFRSWMMKLDGKEEELGEPTPVTFYPKPTEIGSRFEDLLHHYSDYGTVTSDFIMHGFTWLSDPNTTRETNWSRVHGNPAMLSDFQRDCLDSWCEQEGLPVPQRQEMVA